MNIPISVCYITKNESALLEKSLSGLKGFGFELVVIDTGSEDDTISMARRYTDSVFEFPWIDDFSAAKNYAISKAKHDMVMVVDSDEYYLEGDIDRFYDTVQRYCTEVGDISRLEFLSAESGGGESITYASRVFDRRLYHFAGKIHEQVVRGSVFDENRDDSRQCIEESAPLHIFDTGLLFAHTGYLGDEALKKKKAARNVVLLKKELEKYPESPQLLYQTAKSVGVAEGPEPSIPFFEQALAKDLDLSKYWVRDLINCYGYALLDIGEYEKALSLEAVYEDLQEDADYLFLMGLIHMNNALFEQASGEFIHCTGLKAGRSAGTNSFKAYYNAGVIEESLGNSEKAMELYQKAGNYEPAKIGIARLSN